MKIILYNAFRLMRPRQWLKNFALFAAIIFTGHLFEAESFQKTVTAFIVFCLLSSAIYIMNDIFDIEKDRKHPFKRFRPLANNDISVRLALMMAISLTVISFIIGFFVTPGFFIITIVYALLQLSYSAILKHITIIDILSIATGYILRVYAGEFATGFHISVWLLMTTIAISLFLAIGKRRSELTLLTNHPKAKDLAARTTLSHYTERLLDVYASMFATATLISYSLFTFLENPRKVTLPLLLPDYLPDYFQRKWLMITIIPVVYGLMRYLQDIYEKHEGESPEKVLLSDRPLLITVGIWTFLVIAITYFTFSDW